MNRRFIILFFLVCVFSLFGCTEKNTDTLVKIYDKNITFDEFNTYWENYSNVLKKDIDINRKELQNSDISSLKKAILEKMIESEIYQKILQDNSITITDAEINDRLIDEKNKFLSRESFENFLKELEITENFYDQLVKESLLKEKAYNIFISQNSIKEEAIKNEYDTNKNNYIKYDILYIENDNKDILEKILTSNDSLEESAILYSTDVLSAANGGHIRDYKIGNLSPKLDEIVVKLNINEKSEIIQDNNKYFFVLLLNKIEQYEDLKKDIETNLLEKAFNTYIQENRQNTKVHIYKDL